MIGWTAEHMELTDGMAGLIAHGTAGIVSAGRTPMGTWQSGAGGRLAALGQVSSSRFENELSSPSWSRCWPASTPSRWCLVQDPFRV